MIKQKLMDKMVKPMVVDNRKSDVPWQSHSKPLHECKIAVVTTAGVHLKDQESFDVEAKDGDASFRRIPLKASESDYQISHTHYDHAEADKDINCVFPIDILHTLETEGYIGGISEVSFGFMGFILQTLHPKLKESARKVAQELLAENVDIVLMTPG